jgi:hypothetical protein
VNEEVNFDLQMDCKNTSIRDWKDYFQILEKCEFDAKTIKNEIKSLNDFLQVIL